MFERLGLAGRVVMVTGAGAGIGLATAQAFHQADAKVVLTDLDFEAAKAAAARLSKPDNEALSVKLDVSNEKEVDAAGSTVIDQLGRIDILVNNAGLGARVPTVDLTLEQWRRVLAVGLDGSFLCSRAVGRHMIQQRAGSVINVASIMGIVGGGLYPNVAYHASKGALVNMTRALALEWAPHGIRVNAVAPGPIWTPLIPSTFPEEKVENFGKQVPMQRAGQPEEVAPSYVYLASDDASYVSGQVLHVNGGDVVNG